MDQLSCPRCRNTLSEPHLLPCTHNLCHTCLVAAHEDEGKEMLTCPTCSKQTPTPNGDLSLFPPNATLCAVIAMLAQQSTPTTPKPATTNDDGNPRCPRHQDYVIDIYCHDCNDAPYTCSYEVLFEQHKGHNCQPIKEVALGAKDRLELTMQTIASTRAGLKAQVEELVAAQVRVEQNKVAVEKQIGDDIDALIKRLEDHRLSLFRQVRKCADLETQALKRQVDLREEAMERADKDKIPLAEAVDAGLLFEAQKGLITTDLTLREKKEAKAKDNYDVDRAIAPPGTIQYSHAIPSIDSMQFKVWTKAHGAGAGKRKTGRSPLPAKPIPQAVPTPTIDPKDPVGSWLVGLDPALAAYKSTFTEEGFETMEEVALLTAEDLVDIGVEDASHRDMIIAAIKAL